MRIDPLKGWYRYTELMDQAEDPTARAMLDNMGHHLKYECLGDPQIFDTMIADPEYRFYASFNNAVLRSMAQVQSFYDDIWSSNSSLVDDPNAGHLLMPGEGTDLYPSGAERSEPGSGWQLPDLGSGWQLTPLLVNGALYGSSSFNRLFALDPQSDKELWSVDPKVDFQKEVMKNCRGVSSWKGAANVCGICAQRIFMGALDSCLLAVDGATGEACQDFGRNGTVDLKAGLGEHAEFEHSAISPPAILGNALIIARQFWTYCRTTCPVAWCVPLIRVVVSCSGIGTRFHRDKKPRSTQTANLSISAAAPTGRV